MTQKIVIHSDRIIRLSCNLHVLVLMAVDCRTLAHTLRMETAGFRTVATATILH
jgi:hypothetical protein